MTFFPNLNPKATLKEIKYFKETRGWKSVCESRVVFRTQSSIYDGAFFIKIVNNFQQFSQKASTGFSIYTFEKTETFKMKLKLAKSLRLLQRAAFFCSVFSHSL